MALVGYQAIHSIPLNIRQDSPIEKEDGCKDD